MKRGVVIAIVLALAAVIVWFAIRRREHEGATSADLGRRVATSAANGDHTAPDHALPAWFAARGVPDHQIAGRVTFEGSPVPDATVVLHNTLTRATVMSPIERHTSADGTFDFGLRPAAVYDITASTVGKTAALLHFDLADPTLKPPADRLELRLRACAASVSGVVVDATNSPIAHARVLRDGLIGGDADLHGVYRVCVPWGEVELEYSADGYGSVLLTVDARADTHQDVVLVPEAAIAVRALRGTDGQPIPDVIVTANPKDWGRDRATTRSALTDADGRARISGLTPGGYRVYGWGDGMATRSAVDAVAAVGAAPEVILRFDPLARISGKVMAGETPIVGAQVAAIRKSPIARSTTVPTRGDGTFVLELVPIGDVVFLASPYDVKSPAGFRVEQPKDYDGVLIQVEKLSAIRGRVTRLGKPVEAASVCCVTTTSTMGSVFSDADGHYEFAGVKPGTYELNAQSEAVGAFTNPTKLVLGAGEDRNLDIELDLAASIAGVVVDRDGKPVKGVFVKWVHEKTGDLGRGITDDQGRYRCAAMTGGGTYRASVYPTSAAQTAYATADGQPYPAIELKDGTSVVEGVRIAIDYQQLTISGRVVDGVGSPIVDARVKALPVQGSGSPQFNTWQRLPSTFTDPDGSFTLRELAPGTYALQARSADGGEGVKPGVTAGASGVVVTLERPATIVGTLVGFPEPPIVYATQFDTSWRLNSGAVDGTSFRIAGVRPGRYLVNAQTTYEGDAKAVDVHAGETVNVVMTAHGRGAIEGNVLDWKTHEPIADARCHAVMAVDHTQGLTNWDVFATTATSDARGHLVIDPAPAGNVIASCMMHSYLTSAPTAEATLATGGRATVQLLSVRSTIDSPGTIGIEFDWRVTQPRIAAVRANSSGAKAGLVVGDLVVAVGGAAVDGLNGIGILYLIGNAPVGSDLGITVQRGTERKTITAKVEPPVY